MSAVLAARQKCRHCKRQPANRPRSLCCSCYYKRDIRDLYQTRSDCDAAKRGHGWKPGLGLELPEQPTAALPNTQEKIAELQRRAAAGLVLWHPLDAGRDLG